MEAHTHEATAEEREAARKWIEKMTWDELHRVVTALRVDESLGRQVELIIGMKRFADNGPALVIAEEYLDPLEIVKIQELAGQNLDVKLANGRLTVFCPSWSDEEMPF